MVRFHFYNSIDVSFRFHFQHGQFLLLCCTFVVVGQFPFLCLFSGNVTGVYKWETRRQQSYVLCCLCVTWVTAQGLITKGLWKMWWHTCYLCNDIHAEDLAVKFVLYPLTVHVWRTLTFQLSCWGTALLSWTGGKWKFMHIGTNQDRGCLYCFYLHMPITWRKLRERIGPKTRLLFPTLFLCKSFPLPICYSS